MALQTRRIRIGSIIVNRDFLAKLGEILEREVNLRIRSAEEEIERLMEEDRMKAPALNRGNLRIYEEREITKDDIEKWLDQRRKEHGREHSLHYDIEYTIDAGDQQLEFSSMEELLSLNHFPPKIESISFSVRHYDKAFVDISLNFDNSVLRDKKFTISSEDSSKLPKIAEDFSSLFREYRTPYGWVFDKAPNHYIPYMIFTAMFIYVFVYLIVQLAGLIIQFKESAKWIFPLPCLILTIILFDSAGFLYPFFSFELSNTGQVGKKIRTTMGFIFLAMVCSAIYDLLKSII